mmetsp:Transcript_3912/g.7527  ORF Transcript_3912/g.7527 Transcript_3912/m.7527 type:complete len:94 (+) Transcript_3912:104-385(+)
MEILPIHFLSDIHQQNNQPRKENGQTLRDEYEVGETGRDIAQENPSHCRQVHREESQVARGPILFPARKYDEPAPRQPTAPSKRRSAGCCASL